MHAKHRRATKSRADPGPRRAALPRALSLPVGDRGQNAANRADAEEAVQQAFLAFLGKFDPDSEAPPLAWLTLTLKRECWAKRAREHLDPRVGQGAAADPDGSGFCIADLHSEAADPEEAVEELSGSLMLMSGWPP